MGPSLKIVGDMGRREFQKAQRLARARGRAEMIDAALTKHQGNVVAAAKELGITSQYLYLVLRTEFPKGALAKYKKGKRGKAL